MLSYGSDQEQTEKPAWALIIRCAIFSGSANRPLAEAVARILNTDLGKCTTTHLKDSEIHVTIDEVVRDQDVFIIQPCSAPVNDHLMELLLYIDAFRRASAHEITAVIPYYPYGRQERMAKGREAISAKAVAMMLEAMGVSRVIYFDVHAPATQGFFEVPVDPLSALPVLADYFETDEFCNAAIVSPDVGRAKFAGTYAEIARPAPGGRCTSAAKASTRPKRRTWWVTSKARSRSSSTM